MDILRIAIASILVLLLPGYILEVCFSSSHQDPIEKLAKIIGASIALIALFSLLFFVVDIQLNGSGLILIIGILTLTALLLRLRKPSLLRFQPPTMLGLFLVALIVLWRLYQARMLTFPAWVDSPHHALILRTILETGGLPETLLPYLPVQFSYHYAFHTSTALFSNLSGLDIPQAILFFGQVLNAAICLSVYRMVKALWHDWRRAMIAALLIACVSQMPAFYLSWGRYTLLSGLVILPLAIAETVELKKDTVHKEHFLRLSLYVAGVFLSHYFVGILFLLFILSLGIEWIVNKFLRRSQSTPTLRTILVGVVFGLLLSSPWLYRSIQYAADLQPSHLFNGFDNATGGWSSDLAYLIQLAGPVRAHLLFFFGLAGAILLIRSNDFLSISIWYIFILLGCIPTLFHPFSLRPDHFVIVLFLPTTILSSHLFIFFTDNLKPFNRNKVLSSLLICIGTTFLCAWGIYETHNILNPSTILVSKDDQKALDWIEANTDQDARFFINTKRWQGNIFRGVDGGSWILPKTGRWTILPPITYTLGESEDMNEIGQLAEQASSMTTCSDDFWDLIRGEKITHIYIKMTSGTLQPDALTECEKPKAEGTWLHQVAHFGIVFIYQVENIAP